jgi:hypothetical protein
MHSGDGFRNDSVFILALVWKHRFHHYRNCVGIVTVLLSQGPDHLLPAFERMVLVELELAFDSFDLDSEAYDLR